MYEHVFNTSMSPSDPQLSLQHTQAHTHAHTHSPHAEVRGPLVVPLLIISFNLRKQTQAVMSISYHAAAIEAHTPFCLLLQIHGEDRGDGLAEKMGKRVSDDTKKKDSIEKQLLL